MKSNLIHARTSLANNFLNDFRLLIKLTKPGVTLLLVFTAVTTAVAASGPWLDPFKLVLLVLTGAMTAGGAGAINHFLEKDLDRQMPRTANRPLPSGQLSKPIMALVWGVSLAAAGIVISALTLPIETTLFTAAGLVIYVPVYTLLLKRRTTLNVVIGGAAGAFPVLAGWSVARVDWPMLPIALALVVFFWTPAHFWAFAIRHEKDYSKAGFPMLPSILGVRKSTPLIFIHALFAVLASILVLSGLPLVVAALSGIAFLFLCVRLWQQPSDRLAYRVYKASNYYLMLVFLGLLFI